MYVPLDEEYAGGLGYFCFNFMKKHGEKIAQVIFVQGCFLTMRKKIEWRILRLILDRKYLINRYP